MRALLSVSDKTGLVDFARGLRECGVDLIATSSTGRALADSGIEALSVADLTGFPEMLDGRVRTLHPAIHAGILARRDLPEHMRQLAENRFEPIDLVVSSLYPFADTLASGADTDMIVENIDIGGPTLIRAAAKNRDSVAVVVSPRQYAHVLGELREHRSISTATRHRLAAEAFAHVATYDTQVAAWLRGELGDANMPAELTVGGPRLHELRYGENPHQRGALYAIPRTRRRGRSRQGAAGIRALLHQLARRRCGERAGQRLRGARGMRHQAHQPMRLRHRQDSRRRLRPGLRVRPASGVWRHRRNQPSDRPRHRDRAHQDLSRGGGVPGRLG